jgi:uncharacterized protein YecE (DUF72 family)
VTVWIGTSGWQYRDWRGPVYRGLAVNRWLEAYAGAFATVESNAAFYRLPERATFEGWAARTPGDFLWAVKASRYLTHIRRLRDPEEAVDRLVERASGLGSKLGPVLLQLPPRFQAEPARLNRTLARFPAGWRIAVELRDPSWMTSEVRSILEARGAALCLADRRGTLAPGWRTADWTYLRFHEGRARPAPCYGRTSLGRWAERILEGWGSDAEAFVYFNNDPQACAPADAAGFAAICSRQGLSVTRAPRVGEIRPVGSGGRNPEPAGAGPR